MLGAVYMRRASSPWMVSPRKRAGFYFAFAFRASSSRRARHVISNDSIHIVLRKFYCFRLGGQALFIKLTWEVSSHPRRNLGGTELQNLA